MMDVDAIRLALHEAPAAAVGLAFLAGLFFSVNPVAIGAIPVALAYVTRARERGTALRFGFMFIAGLLVAHAILGIVAGLGGLGVELALGRYWGLVLGPLLIYMGLIWLGWARAPLPALRLRPWRVSGAWGAFALGIPFSVAICPICTPALVVLLGLVTGIGSPVLGGALLLAFAFGRSVPIAAGAWALGALEHFKPLGRYQRAFDKTGGALLVGAGLYMLNAYLLVVPELAV